MHTQHTCMYARVFACMHACLHAFTRTEGTDTHARNHTHMHARKHTYTYTQSHTQIEDLKSSSVQLTSGLQSATDKLKTETSQLRRALNRRLALGRCVFVRVRVREGVPVFGGVIYAQTGRQLLAVQRKKGMHVQHGYGRRADQHAV